MHGRGISHFILSAFGLLTPFIFLHCGDGSSSQPTETTVNDMSFISTPAVACEQIPAPNGGNTFYLDPVNGSNDNSGSAANPWGSLQSLVEDAMIETRVYANLPYDGTNTLVAKNPGAPVKAGDTLVLLDGFHGEFFLRGAYNEYPITIAAAVGHRPTMDWWSVHRKPLIMRRIPWLLWSPMAGTAPAAMWSSTIANFTRFRTHRPGAPMIGTLWPAAPFRCRGIV